MLTSGIFYFLMGSATGLVIFGMEILVILFIFRVKESFDDVKEIRSELRQVMTLQRFLECSLKGLAGLGPKVEEVLKMHKIEA